MVPKPPLTRLLNSMQLENTEWQTWTQPPDVAAVELEKELKLKLSLEMRNRGDVIIVHCQGRIVYRDEAAALSRVVGEVLRLGSNVILDLGGVDSMDSAGIGELVLLYTVARERNANLKWANPNGLVRTLLGLTNLDTVLDVHPSVDSALEALGEEQVCADC
jgi:anti-sigma B factor antagonist